MTILTVVFFDVVKFTKITPLSLVILCKLFFPIVGLKITSCPTLALKSPNSVLCDIWEIYREFVPIPHKSYLL